jgi:hypothetical protein
MSRYQKGKIYGITHTKSTKDLYIGSSCDFLPKRLTRHKVDSRRERYANRIVYQKMQQIGEDCFKISLIESYPCKTKLQLVQREQHWINKLQPNLNGVNAKEEKNKNN